MSFISVIIPFKKGKRYLRDCLDSLSDQNLENEEIIIIINGSFEEDINDLIDSYTNKLNIIVKSFENELGVARARNEGLKIAQGKYVYFIDSDDYLYEDALSKLIDVAFKTDADFINGERINTYFIRNRFNEELLETTLLKQNKLNNEEYSFKLLIGTHTNSLEVLSVLHALIKKDVIEDVLFNEQNRYFSDYEFILNIFDNINSFHGVEDAIYAKRQSDDPIKLPSLSQEEKGDEFLLYCKEYETILDKISSLNAEKYVLLKEEMLNKFYKYYYDSFAINYARNPDNKWRKEYFDELYRILTNFNSNKLSLFKKMEMKAFQDKNTKKLKLFIQFRFIFNRFKQMAKSYELIKTLIYLNIFNKKPLNEKQIFIESFRGDFYSDSPKYLYQYLLENYGDEYEFVWVMNHKGVKIPGNPKTVKKYSLSYFRQAAKSKYWLTNTRQPALLSKRKDQILISTWHGTPLKRLGFDMGNLYLDDPESKFKYKKDSSEWDYLISPNEFTTEKLRSSFAYDGKVLEYGYPRNDILYNYDDGIVNKIKSDLNLPKDKKIILYAPTWRDDESYDIGKVRFNLKLDLDLLKKSLSDEYIILVRTHYFISNNLNLSNFKGFAFDVSKYEDIAELYLISDILITDYSSVFFDFANLKRPILFYTYDLDKYSKMLRGFYLDITREVPGPLLFTTEEVIDAIEHIDELKIRCHSQYEEFYQRFCSIDDGHASKRIVEEIWRNNTDD